MAERADEPPEHARFAAYTLQLEHSAPAEEPVLVRRVLTDPDRTMAESAVTRHLDRRAAAIHATSAYTEWAESMTAATAGHGFLTDRLREWTLFRAVCLTHPWDPEALTRSSNWLQLKLAEAPATPTPALTLLADQGRTKRIRHLARTSLRLRREGT
ncbi:hypothetical protein ACM01_23020 [Streptomyces viridochromogenes]|uniref:Uncharacterized protein n=1 Tax=Streptomyces viridochromogenes TaxID=1938 RepID=A0A0J7Z9L2_STRVR|nr:hypothetical protein ACM01_23020 [Streptomyces viridochromogenes]KOG17596.1 hypothetical protein ADK36_24215 [Streptomyces viridochromogenes]KOG25829.1 hypothetical protein ADK35_08230 [Streptomyces viridochromogenes]